MRKLLLLLALAAHAWADSFILGPGIRVTTVFPLGSPMCQGVTQFRAEGHFQVIATPVSTVVIHRQSTSWELNLDAAMNLGTLVLNTGGGPFVNISGWTYVRWRFRRSTSPAQYTIEVTNEQTGEVKSGTLTDANPGSTNPIGCDLYTGAQGSNPATVNVGAIRIYSTAGALGAEPALRLLPPGSADLLQLEFEGNLLDTSGRGLSSSATGGTSYAPTVALPPKLSIVHPTTVRAKGTASLVATCLSNEDQPDCSLFYTQVGSSNGKKGKFKNRTSPTLATFTTDEFGEYNLLATVTTGTQSASQRFDIGAAATDNKGVLKIPNADHARIIGQAVRHGINPWSYVDDRALAVAQVQIDQQTGANGALPFWSADNWAFNLAGTISVTNGSATITGVGTQFQRDFCGGVGRTVPNTYASIYVKYTNADYPADKTLARPAVISCISQTQMTINQAWGWSTGTQTGLNYARGTTILDTTQLGTGTVSVTNGSATVTGTGTNFQAAYCANTTTPTSPAPSFWIEFVPDIYPGRTEVLRVTVAGCPSANSLTLTEPWLASDGTQTGRRYGQAQTLDGWWTNTNTPGNYYDNVLGFYKLYYVTGLTKYRNAARKLAENWWNGPYFGRGKNWDASAMGGTYMSAGPARGLSLTGLFLWALDTGENIWPGMQHVLAAQKAFGWDYFNTRSWDPALIGIGDLREQGYLLNAYALAARYHPTYAPYENVRTLHRGYVKDYLTKLLAPLQHPAGDWRWISPQNANYAGSSYVNVINNNTNITLVGATWSAGTFCNGNFNPCDYQTRAWFFSDYSKPEMPGKQNSDLGGESVFYRVTNVTSPTTATLDRPYEGTTGSKGMEVSSIVGFGNQPFMQSLATGVIATSARDAMLFHGDTTEAALALSMATLSASWLAGPEAYKSSERYLYGASKFLNCVAEPDMNGCAGGSVVNGEGIKGQAAVYLAAPTAPLLAQGDALYHAIWCKPTGGFTCPFASYGTYGDYIDNPGVPNAFMINPRDPLTNKWFGFFFGYGFVWWWPAARMGGMDPADIRTIALGFTPPANVISTSVDCRDPVGNPTSTVCGSTSCSLSQDLSPGNHSCQIVHTVPGGTRKSSLTTLVVQ